MKLKILIALLVLCTLVLGGCLQSEQAGGTGEPAGAAGEEANGANEPAGGAGEQTDGTAETLGVGEWAVEIKSAITLTPEHKITETVYEDLKSVDDVRFEITSNCGKTSDKLFKFEPEHKIVMKVVDAQGEKTKFYTHAYKEASNREFVDEMEVKIRLYHQDVPSFAWMDIGEDGFIRESYEAYPSTNSFYNPAIAANASGLKLRLEIVDTETGQTLAFGEYTLA